MTNGFSRKSKDNIAPLQGSIHHFSDKRITYILRTHIYTMQGKTPSVVSTAAEWIVYTALGGRHPSPRQQYTETGVRERVHHARMFEPRTLATVAMSTDVLSGYRLGVTKGSDGAAVVCGGVVDINGGSVCLSEGGGEHGQRRREQT
ncbi:hypothetical protein CBL_00781 [Carabus blaptoides fortunei]